MRPRLRVVDREVEVDLVARKDADVASAAHLAGGSRQNFETALDLDLEHRIREGLEDRSLHANHIILLGQKVSQPWALTARTLKSHTRGDAGQTRSETLGLVEGGNSVRDRLCGHVVCRQHTHLRGCNGHRDARCADDDDRVTPAPLTARNHPSTTPSGAPKANERPS